jgi:hypothetical protein
MNVRRGTGETKLVLFEGICPGVIVLWLGGLSFKLLIVKGGSSADHARRGMSGTGGTGMIGLARELIRGRRGMRGWGWLGREWPRGGILRV